MTKKTENIYDYRKSYYQKNREYLIAYAKLYYLKTKKEETDSKKPKIKGNTKFNKKYEPIIEKKEEEIKEEKEDDVSRGSVVLYFD